MDGYKLISIKEISKEKENEVDLFLEKNKQMRLKQPKIKGRKNFPWQIPWEHISDDIEFITTYGLSHKRYDASINKRLESQNPKQSVKHSDAPKKWERVYMISEDIDIIDSLKDFEVPDPPVYQSHWDAIY